MDLPKLEKTDNKFKFYQYSPEERANVVKAYLFDGFSHRQLDSQILELDADYSKGFESMNILRYLGLNSSFKGIFSELSVDDAISELKSLSDDSYIEIQSILEAYLRNFYKMNPEFITSDDINELESLHGNLSTREFNKLLFTKDEEEYYIHTINNLINDLENQLKLISNPHYHYNIIILEKKICHLILKLILKKNGYGVDSHSRFMGDIRIGLRFNLIPEEIEVEFHKIQRYRNQTVHIGLTNDLLFKSLYSFNKIILWFDKYSEYNNALKIKEYLLVYDSLSKEDLLKFKSDYSNSKDSFPKIITKRQSFENDESEYINHINELLNEFENDIGLIFNEDVYYASIISAQKICELMLGLYLRKNGYSISNDRVDDNNQSILHFCSFGDVLPDECKNFINTIRINKNRILHDDRGGKSYKLVFSYLKAFKYFLLWFNNFYSDSYHSKKLFYIENCCYLINLLPENKDDSVAKLDYELYLKFREGKEQNDEKEFEKVLDSHGNDDGLGNAELLVRLEKYENEIAQLRRENAETSKKQEIQLNEIKGMISHGVNEVKGEISDASDKQSAQISEVSDKQDETLLEVKNIKERLDVLNSSIEEVQSLTENLLEKADDDEKDRIFGEHIDRCIVTMEDYILGLKKEYLYEYQKGKIKDLLGENAWSKLSEESKNFLISSKITYDDLNELNEDIDFSGVSVLVTKAIEVEMYKRFFANFLDYLDEHYEEDYSVYPTSLVHENKRYKTKSRLRDDKFSFGKIAYILCFKQHKYEKYAQKRNNKEKLLEYCRSEVFSKYSDDDKIEELLNDYASDLEKIRKNYRNPSAHRGLINQTRAEECLNFVLYAEKILRKMLESFDE